jgi:hypothetical protein
MAHRLGVNTATLSSWEGNRATPHRTVAERLAHKMEELFPGKVTAAWLLGQEPGDPEASPVGTAGITRDPNYVDLIENPWLPRMDSNHQPPDGSVLAGQSPEVLSVSRSRQIRQLEDRPFLLNTQEDSPVCGFSARLLNSFIRKDRQDLGGAA